MATRTSEDFSQSAKQSTKFRLWGMAILCCILLLLLLFFVVRTAEPEPITNVAAWRIPTQFSADRSFGYLQSVCAIGPRPSGSVGMSRQQEMLTNFFRKNGAVIELQSFQARHPQTGKAVELNNLIARWFPQRNNRVLLCAHYDTRPFPDRDPTNPGGVFIGANDGGSGVAVLMELSNHLLQLPGSAGVDSAGVDIVLFDGEELVFREPTDPYFLGSTHFAQQVAAGQMPGNYQAGVLLDMVGDRELSIFYERNSLKYAKDVCREVWSSAKRMNIDAFVPISRHEIRDDHLPLNTIAKIPVADLIDFDYPHPRSRGVNYWHTEADTPDKCSGRSLAAVSAVVYDWLITRNGANR